MENLILKGPPLSVPKIDKGIGEYFFERTEIYGKRNFQIDADNGNTETFFVVRQKSTRVAIHLQKMGVKPKDIVMICCLNNLDNIIPALAAFYIGAYVASVDPKQTISDVRHAIRLIEPSVIFVEENSLCLIEKSLEDFHINPKIIAVGNSDKYVKMYDTQIETEEEKSFKPIKQIGSDIAGIIFSSGTTSAPKGIYLSNSFVLNGAHTMIQHKHLKPGVILHLSSFYWVSTWLMTGVCILTGTAKVIGPNITAEKFLRLVEKYKITHLFTSCTFTYGITDLPKEVVTKYDTSTLYNICLGGSTMDPQQIRRLRKLLPYTYVALGYGSSEGNCIAIYDFLNQRAYEEKISSSGTVASEMQIKIVCLENGTLLGPNKEGEIRIKSPFLMSGYHNFNKPDIFDEDGFLKMGDIGYYDDDQYIYITDRLGEMFKYRVNQLSPSTLEHTLLSHPAVAEAVVFGIPHPVDRNHPGACVVLKEGTNPTVQELLNFVNSKVADHFKLRAGLCIFDVIPKTPTGKIQRRTIRDLFIKARNG